MGVPVGRRTLLVSGAAAVGGVLALGTCELVEGEPGGDPAVVEDAAAEDAHGRATTPFRGAHQGGVVTPPQGFASWVALDLVPGVDRDALVRLMRIWTDDIERLTQGRPPLADLEPELAAVPARLSVTVGFGPAVLTAAGRQDQRPDWLGPLPAFTVDRLEDAWSGGDLILQVCADAATTVAHATRMLVKGARTFAKVRWVQRGFANAAGTVPTGTTPRNLMGQVDGTANPRPGTSDDALIWVGDSGPSWLHAGTSMVVRRIAMDLDGWDRLGRADREQVIGRRLDNGAPLTGRHERDVPDLAATTALGFPVIETFAHVRRARPDEAGQRILRRGYSYDEAPAPGRVSNSGLVFVSFQADIAAQFIPIQRRLDELDLLNRWTTPIGSAVFAVPPGCGPGEYLGQRLLEA